ncbi:MAG: efflux RND transporter periplasmic adaptor subunit [Bacteroidaceae bacterium]|nr:efflux RND transporter periplasmic adaptor subunit [Bacteroidaceae bacterium]
MKKIGIKICTIFLGAITIVCLDACKHEMKVSYKTEKSIIQDLATTITATGTIEPVTKVEVGTQVSGIIDKIYVDYNSIVHRGQVIAELDKTNLLSELQSCRSNLASAQSSYQSSVSTFNYQQSNYKRYKALYDKGLISADDYENARMSYENARMSMAQAQQQISVQQQNVQKAQTNLGYATITAPIDGVVLSKEVEEGQTVASAMTTPTLFIIAKDLTDMRVIADIDEADIGGVQEGQRVTFAVDAFPEDVFEGSVTQVRQQATTESNVVTYQVVIAAPNEELKLKPGLTANVTIFTSEKKDVLTVPSKALRFTPNEVMLTKEESIKDCNAPAKVWMKEGNVFKAIPVTTGLSNGLYTEITNGLKPGTEIITEFEVESPFPDAGQQTNPFMPGPRNRNRGGAQGGQNNSNAGGGPK